MSQPTSGLSPADAASCLPRKTFDCEVKSLDDSGSFELYAACFGNVDRGGDLIEPGAFVNLAEFVKDGWIALNHVSAHLPVGLPLEATQDAHGLLIGGRFHSTPKAQECRTVVKERMEAGKAVKCSIGYVTIEESYDKRDGRTVRHLKKLGLYEVSFVNLAMNNSAEVISAKGATPPSPSIDPEEDTMSETEKGAVNALKRLLGLEAKKSVAISAANREKLGGYCDAMDVHHKAMAESCKAMKDCHGAMCKTMGEMKEFVKSFEPGDVDEDAEGDEQAPRGKRKDDDPEETAGAGPRPKGGESPEGGRIPSPNDQALTIYRDQLKHRGNAGRAIQSCP